MRKITRKRVRILLSLVLSLLLLASYQFSNPSQTTLTPPPPPPGYFQVISFSDGDTFSVRMNDQEERVRLIGVDTPETHDPDSPPQCFGQQASDFTKRTIGSQAVRLEADPTNDNRDRYGRLLRYAYLPDNTLLNELLIREGYGFAYTQFPFTKKEQFIETQSGARSGNKGLWGVCSVTNNNGRWRTNNVGE